MNFIEWLNKVEYGDGDFIDEQDWQSWADEYDIDETLESLHKKYDRYNALAADRSEADEAADDELEDDIELDEAEDEELVDDEVADDELDTDDKVSDENCKNIIDDMSNDELAPVYKWARAEYEPAKGLSDQEIGMKFAIDDNWATDLATAYYEANPDLLDKEDTGDSGIEETTIVSEEDTNGDGNTDTVSIDVSGDGVEDDTVSTDEVEHKGMFDDFLKDVKHYTDEEKKALSYEVCEDDDSMANILSALVDHRY